MLSHHLFITAFYVMFFFLWKKKNEKKPQGNDIQHVSLIRYDVAFVLL